MKGLKAFYIAVAVAQGALLFDSVRYAVNMSSPEYRPKRKKFKGWQRQLRGGK